MSDPVSYLSSDGYWTGRFAAVVGESARMIEHHDHLGARRYLHETLAEFIASPCPYEETRKLLRPYLERGKK
jgi:hypothetical protein